MIVAGTGHRPDKLGGYGLRVFEALVHLADNELRSLQSAGPIKAVISGMALGWDQALARAAVNLNLPLWAYVPFDGQELAWPMQSQVVYRDLLLQASKIYHVCPPGYAGWKMQKRNQAMVNDCTHVLALWNGTPGGTANCVKYAGQDNFRPITNCWERWERRNG